MDNVELVKTYFEKLDSSEFEQAEQFLAENYQLVDFTQAPMSKDATLAMLRLLKDAIPNLSHSLSNMRVEGNVVKITVQLSGNNSRNLDLRSMGIGVIPSSQKFIIFPNGNFEFTVVNQKITVQRDVSPVSPNRRISGMLKALGVNMSAL